MLFLIAHYTAGESWPLVAVLNNAAVQIMMLAMPAVMLIGLAPRYRSVWILLVIPGLLVLVIWQGGLFIPQRGQTPQPGDLTVVTYNTAGVDDLPVSRLTGEIFPEADLISLQEFPATNQHGPQDSLLLHSRLGIHSTYPLVPDTVQFVYENVNIASERRGRLSALRTLIRYQGQDIAVYNVHPRPPRVDIRRMSYNGQLRASVITGTMALVQQESVPVILLCDCNFALRTDDYRQVAKLLTDSWRQRGFGLGWTAPAPATATGFPVLLARPDHIWHSHHFETISVQVRYDVAYSDHYPLQATLRLRDGSSQAHE